MNIAELFARIGIKTDEKKVKSFQSSMQTLKGTMVAATVTAAGVSAVLGKIANDAMKSAVAFKQFEAETGASAQTLQKWQSVAEQTNQSAESVNSAVKAIADNQQKIKLGQGNISGYQLLGIDPQQDPFDILEELRVKTANLDEAMKKQVLSQMGVGAGLIQTLSLTREEFDAMAGNAFIISPAAIESLNAMKSGLDQARRAVAYIKAQIATSLGPEIKKLTKDFIKFVKVNETGIIKGFKTAYGYVRRFVQLISTTAQAVNWLVTSTIGWENAIKVAAIAFAGLNAIMMASPMGLITAGIILLIAVLDDLYVYSKGGKSAFGALMEKFPELEKTILAIVMGIKDALTIIKGILKDDLTIQDAIEEWGTFGGIIAGITELMETGLLVAADDIKMAFEKIQNIINGLKTFISGGGFGDLAKELGPVVNALYSGVTGEGGFFKHTLSGAKEGLERSVIGGAISSRVERISESISNNFNINITGGGDPEETGAAVGRAIQRVINGASAQRSRDE
jgi:hypothetical protein